MDFYINFQDFKQTPIETFLLNLTGELNKYWETNFTTTNISDIFYKIERINDKKCILIIDEVEGINQEYFGIFLHAIRKVCHSRKNHCLKSVILIGVSNIVGVVQDYASPFNITDNLNVPYFTNEEVFELLGQHETETGQLFEEKVKNKICQITANQPGLVNGFAKKIVDDYPDKEKIDYEDYVKRRGIKAFMEKDENGNYKSLKEAALIYSFETFITATMHELNGKIYREADTGLGKSDIIINIANKEFLIETKIYYSPGKFTDGKEQLAYYCKSLILNAGVYLVFCPNDIRYPETVKEQNENIDGVEISSYLIPYDETKW